MRDLLLPFTIDLSGLTYLGDDHLPTDGSDENQDGHKHEDGEKEIFFVESYEEEAEEGDDYYGEYYYNDECEEGSEEDEDNVEEKHQEEQYYDNGTFLFKATYRCYGAPAVHKTLDEGNRIIMPPSALDWLEALEVEYPLFFKIRNRDTDVTSHVGVLEFSADDGHVYLPRWVSDFEPNKLLEELKLKDGDMVELLSASLPKAQYMKLQPQSREFLNLPDPKAILEKQLRSFCCLTEGDSFLITFGCRKLYFNVIEVTPGSAVSILETDCEVEFAPPLELNTVPSQPPPTLATDDKVRESIRAFEKFKPFAAEESEKEFENKKFEPFTGKSYFLRDHGQMSDKYNN
ncbi:hypothetical protein QJS04_geneDACA001325 [Acorus gramineus]|uniref:Ubiquitin fusion degradaton protein n=1 Tax=Acorus gramineus TaxID=55184 RepID=A0AAV9ABG6_ACOGR|nr:hypothetical protein QJS04_geneDACA001325 [Acorus gramineus]